MADLHEVREALESLDHSEDSCWTASGLPAVDAVRKLLDDDSVTRAMIEKAAPNFMRSVDPPDDTEAVEEDSSGVEEVVAAVRTREAAEAELTLKLDNANEVRNAILEEIGRLRYELDQVDRECGELRAEFDREFPPLSDAERYKQFTARQQAERAKKINLAKKTQKPAVNRSPLDIALSTRKRPAHLIG